jgi:hypothetical protein
LNTRTFALALGILLLVVGIAGFIPGLVTYGVPPEAVPGTADTAAGAAVMHAHGYLLGLFAVNAFHNIVHVAWGIFGIAAYRSFSGARLYARATAVVYAVLFVAGLVPGLNTLFGLVPLYGHDVWLHALLALAGAYFGFVRPADVDRVGDLRTSPRV